VIEQKEKQTIKTDMGYEIKVTRMSKDDVVGKLAEFEVRNDMISSEFMRKWNHGELRGDCWEYVDWAGYCELAGEFGFDDLKIDRP
jgi:hypothetical protein